MPRKPRPLVPSGLYHTNIVGVNRGAIFIDEVDANAFVDRFARVIKDEGETLLARSELTNHQHSFLNVEDPEGLPRIMQRVNGPHAQHFNKRHGRSGPLLNDRYFATLVEPGRHALNVLRYVIDNPRKHGVVRGFRALERSSRSSYGAMLGIRECAATDVAEALRYFGDSEAQARRALRAFMFEKRHARDDESSGDPSVVEGFDFRIAGSPEFVGRMKDQIRALNPDSILSFSSDLTALVREVAFEYGVPASEIEEGARSPDVSIARAVVAFLAVTSLRIRRNIIAKAVGISPQSMPALVARGRAERSRMRPAFDTIRIVRG